jgi:hypothetical protein
MMSLGKFLMISGGAMFLFGLILMLGARAGLGQLPGDVSIQRGNTSFYFPIVTSILISIGLTIVLNLVLRFWR